MQKEAAPNISSVEHPIKLLEIATCVQEKRQTILTPHKNHPVSSIWPLLHVSSTALEPGKDQQKSITTDLPRAITFWWQPMSPPAPPW